MRQAPWNESTVDMLAYTLKRLVYVTPVAIGVSIVCFLLVHITPETLGWGVVVSIGATACRAAVKAVIESVSGLNGDSTQQLG